MTIELYKKPKNVTIIEGFPGFGLVGSITTEFLVDHLHAELIGKIFLPKQPAIATIHKSSIVYPMSIYYSKEKNLIILEGLYVVPGSEWDIASDILKIAEETKAKDIISLEGVHLPPKQGADGEAANEKEPSVYFYTSNWDQKPLKSLGYESINEGVVMGVSGSLLLKNRNYPHCCLFVEARIKYPDSAAAAKLIDTLNKIIKINIDYAPLLESAKEFEEKLKGIVMNTENAKKINDQKQMNYVG